MGESNNLMKSTGQFQLISIDWSYTKGLTTFDGKKVRYETVEGLIKRIGKDGGGRDSRSKVNSRGLAHLPSLVVEQGCPLSILYRLTRAGFQVSLISNRAAKDYRREHGVEKSDEADAKIIWELAKSGAKLQRVAPDDRVLRMHDLYHQYCRYQKARVAMENMRKAHERAFGDGDSVIYLNSTGAFQPSPSEDGESTVGLNSKRNLHPFSALSPYDEAINALKTREKELLKQVESVAKPLPLLEGGESSTRIQSETLFHPPQIKGLGLRIWVGIVVTANPASFKCLSAYLRYCGLVDPKSIGYRYNRHAKMLYHMLAEEVVKQKDPKFRAIYDKCKANIAERHPDYTKRHIHNAALNRTATFLAKEIYKTMRR